MSSEERKPKVGDTLVDATDLGLVDRLPDAVRRMTKVHEGWETAAANLFRLTPEQVRRAGLNAEDIARLSSLVDEKKRIVELRPVTERLGEMLRDTDSMRSHEIASIIGEQAAQARRRADRSSERDEILGPLGDLLNYQYGPAIKAAETRAKNSRDDDKPSTEPPVPSKPAPRGAVSQVAPTPQAQAAPTAQGTPPVPPAPPASSAS